MAQTFRKRPSKPANGHGSLNCVISYTPKPTEIVLHQKPHSLEIAFDDGARFDLACELLRVYSPSCEVRGHRGQHAELQIDKQDVNITEIRPQFGSVRLENTLRPWKQAVRLLESVSATPGRGRSSTADAELAVIRRQN